MIIPIRCFSCGKVIAHRWREYVETLTKEQAKIVRVDEDSDKTPEGKLLDKMGFTRPCCRRMFLTHVDMSEKI